MATVKFYLDQRAVKPGNPAPLKIQIIHNRKVAYIATHILLNSEQWDNQKNAIINLTKGLKLALDDKRNGSDNHSTAISKNANPSPLNDINSISDAKIDNRIEVTKEKAVNLNSLAKIIQTNGALNPVEFLLALEAKLGRWYWMKRMQR